VRVVGSGASVSLGDLAARANPLRGAVAPGTEPGLEATAYFGPERGVTASGVHAMVLEVDPDMEDALYNRDLLKDLLEQSQDSQGGEQGNQENASESGDGAQQSEGQSQSDQSGEEGASGDPGEEGESSVRDQENANQEDLDAMQAELERAAQEAQQQSGETQQQQGMSQADAEAMRRAQEQRQAMEQWLRRIPNDPGGLLRRKFRYQYQRQGRDQDGNNLWPDDEVQPW